MRQPLPFIVLPLEHDPHDPHQKQEQVQVIELNEPFSGEVHAQAQTLDDEPRLRYQREASTVELFYDLFFVANLAVVSEQQPITNTKSAIAYLAYFTILWVTWLQTILYDVRFATESIFHHVHKAFSFAVILGFGICRSSYDVTHPSTTIKGLKAMSFVLMASRLGLALQYGIVFVYVRRYPRTRGPIFYSFCVLFCTAVAHLIIAFLEPIFPDCYLFWYPISAIEASLILGISCRWRVLSFTRTHLIERLGLLTLIICGEGVLDISRISFELFEVLKRPDPEYYAELFCTVLMMYMIFLLYFSHVEHGTFGKIKQQVWLVLHYPLHVAILFTVVGSSTLSLTGVIGNLLNSWANAYPGKIWNHDWAGYFNQFSTSAEVVSSIAYKINDVFGNKYKDNTTIINAYNYTFDLFAINDIKSPISSSEWQTQAVRRIENIWEEIDYAVFSSLGIHGHDTNIELPAAEQATSAAQAMNTVFLYYFFAAGGLLIILAIMYPFANSSSEKAKETRLAVAVRVVIGLALMLPSMTYWINTNPSYQFYTSAWTGGAVMLAYLLVLVLDRVIYWHCNRNPNHSATE